MLLFILCLTATACAHVNLCIVVRTYWKEASGPESLPRLLDSLENQTYTNWTAVLFNADPHPMPLDKLVHIRGPPSRGRYKVLTLPVAMAKQAYTIAVAAYDRTDYALYHGCPTTARWALVTNGDNLYLDGIFDHLDEHYDIVAVDFFSRYVGTMGNLDGVAVPRFVSSQFPHEPACMTNVMRREYADLASYFFNLQRFRQENVTFMQFPSGGEQDGYFLEYARAAGWRFKHVPRCLLSHNPNAWSCAKGGGTFADRKCIYPVKPKPHCKIGIAQVGNATQIWHDWRQAMIKGRGSSDWWNFRDTELAIGPLFEEALRNNSMSHVFTPHLDKADFIFVTFYATLVLVNRYHSSTSTHPIYKDHPSIYPFAHIDAWQAQLNEFTRTNPVYNARQGRGFIFEHAHVYGTYNHKWLENNLQLSTDPAAQIPGKRVIRVPYATVWPGANISGLPLASKRYWLTFMGGLNGDQRKRLDGEFRRLADPRVHWNDPRISRNSSDRWDWMAHSKFCLDPTGDVLSTLREYEPLMVGCVPVMLTHYDYPFVNITGPYTQWAIVLPSEARAVEIVKHLEHIGDADYVRLQKAGLAAARNFLYPNDAVHNIVHEICALKHNLFS